MKKLQLIKVQDKAKANTSLLLIYLYIPSDTYLLGVNIILRYLQNLPNLGRFLHVFKNT